MKPGAFRLSIRQQLLGLFGLLLLTGATVLVLDTLNERATVGTMTQLRADSLQDRVLRNATQRDVWRLERLAAERAKLAAERRADSLSELLVKLPAPAVKKKR